MTDTPIDARRKFLLPVTYRWVSPLRDVFDTPFGSFDTSLISFTTLIPASRLADLEAKVARLRRVEAAAQGVSRALEIHGYPVSEAAWENTGETMSAEARQLHLAALYLRAAIATKGAEQ